MKSYIFKCNWETFEECHQRRLFGSSRNFAFDIAESDLCFLYQYDLNRFFGVWRAVSRSGWHERDAWGGRFKHQVRVELLTDEFHFVPFSYVRHLVESSGALMHKLDNLRSKQILDCFESKIPLRGSHGETLCRKGS